MVRVLIVEDDALIGLDLLDQLSEAGHEVIGPATNSRQALDLILASAVDLAILDVNLGNGTTSEPVAFALRERHIPFVTVSGYSSNQHPEVFRYAPLLVKPIEISELTGLLARLSSKP